MPRRRAAFVFFVAMLFPLASYAEAKEDLVIGVAQFPETLHPYFEPTYLGSYMRGFATRQVTAFDADWKSVCLICTEIPSPENGRLRPESTANDGTGLAATYTLRPDLYRGDGEKVTTKDVEFTWRVTRDPNSGALLAGDTWRQIARVEVVDEQTAILHFQPQSYRFNRIPELLPEHIEGPVHARAATPADYMNNTSYARAPTTPGLYNAPYLLVGYQRGAEIVLEPNPYWRGPKPGFKRILVRTIADTAALQANLLSGDLDMVTGDGGISMTVDQVIPLEKRFPDRFVYLIKPTPNFVRVDLALETPVLADVRVRRTAPC